MWQTHSAFTYKRTNVALKCIAIYWETKKQHSNNNLTTKTTHTTVRALRISVFKERKAITHTQLWVCSNWMMNAGLSPCWRGVKSTQRSISDESCDSVIHIEMESWCAGRNEGQCSCRPPSPQPPSKCHTSPEIRHASQLQSHRTKNKKQDIICVLIMIDSFIPLLDTAAERADVEECYHWLTNVKIWKKCTQLNHRIRLTAKALWNGCESLKRCRARFSYSSLCVLSSTDLDF